MDHPNIAKVLDAGATEDQGQYDEAASSFRQSLDIRSRKVGPEDADVARTLNSLAGIYWTQE
jgi:kinesin light chain